MNSHKPLLPACARATSPIAGKLPEAAFSSSLFSALMLAFAAAAPCRAAEPAPNSCCAGCMETPPSSPALSDRSVYQINAALTDDAGRPLRLASLLGRPVVIALFFTNCAYACPLTVSDMRRIREALPPPVRAKARFVLVSFDTERDTPDVLRAYREHNRLGEGWILAGGRGGDVREIAEVLGVKYVRDSRGQYAHSNLITVLNSEGEIAFQRAGLRGDIAPLVAAVTAAALHGQ